MGSDQQFDELNGFLREKFHELLAKFDNIFLLFFHLDFVLDVLKSSIIILFVLDENFQKQLMFVFLFC